MQIESTLTCFRCGHQSAERMPTDACQFFYVCKGCGETLKPLPGDCCVFCSYGTVPCPLRADGTLRRVSRRDRDWAKTTQGYKFPSKAELRNGEAPGLF